MFAYWQGVGSEKIGMHFLYYYMPSSAAAIPWMSWLVNNAKNTKKVPFLSTAVQTVFIHPCNKSIPPLAPQGNHHKKKS